MSEFVYDAEHLVVVCCTCGSCIIPTERGRERHLSGPPHNLRGEVKKATVELLAGYGRLRSLEELGQEVQQLNQQRSDHGQLALPVQGLTKHSGFCCVRPQCSYCTRNLVNMKKHLRTEHGLKAAQQKTMRDALWNECELQTYFTGGDRIRYFVVAPTIGTHNNTQPLPAAMQQDQERLKKEDKLFQRLSKDVEVVAKDQEEAASVVQDFMSKADRAPWLERTEFVSHLRGLKDKEIHSSYQLPTMRQHQRAGDGSDSDGEPEDYHPTQPLHRMVKAAESLLRDAYKLCGEHSKERKMTQQRAKILNSFYIGASGQSDGFRSFKNPSTLKKYFTTFKQLLVYYYNVPYNWGDEHGENPVYHFTRTQPDQVLPNEVIESTPAQREAMNEIMALLDDRTMDDVADEDNDALKHAIRKLYMALICQTVGSAPFRSAVLSFCAMLSRRKSSGGSGLWEDAGNYNSYLSALTWTAQLIIFSHACSQNRDDEDRIPVFLTDICSRVFQQLAETPFGHILQWRLYLFQVSKRAIAKHQARWAIDGQSMTYRGVVLRMSHVEQLVASEFRQAHSLLYEELMFKAQDLVPMHSWRLQDDLDIEDNGASWLTNKGNAEFLWGYDVALLRKMQSSVELRRTFLVQAEDAEDMALSKSAVALYEGYAQQFLKHLLILCHITAGQPLREPELLSITWCNTARQRHIYIWEKLVLIYTQYHKGQQQSGVYRDNARFLPRAIGDMLLDYVAYVLPLRQIFLRHQKPKALISPYLWAKTDGVWSDGAITACLKRACKRANVPLLHTSNWRQMSVSICKEKFSGKDRASFDLEGGDAVDDEEVELVAMAEQSNHTYRTFNQTYAGSSTLTMNVLLHRAYRASGSWHCFFRFDRIIGGKRPRGASDVLSLRVMDDARRSQVRQRNAYSEADLLTVARRLYGKPDMQFRAGQSRGLLAMMGPGPAEQVVLVLGTGSGKTLLVQLGTAVAEARTTLVILPSVALRGDMIRRCRDLGIEPLVWSIGCRRTASLVIVSAEAACTEGFLEYAQMLQFRQQLDRIVIDEAHLTITASDYRPCMLELGWYVRQVRTQTVWLTATLPPAMEGEFVQQNKLVRPTMVRETTNRPGIQYLIDNGDGGAHGSLLEKAAEYIQEAWASETYFNHARDKIIVYCRTKADVRAMKGILDCHAYTSDLASEEEKAAVIREWLSDRSRPVIAATSALGVGFDYPHVRWVIHVDEPDRLTDFSQESGRAGRDGAPAASIVILRSTWKPDKDVPDPDRHAMQLYLTRLYCCRGVLSQFLDQQSDWRWCMDGEQACHVCGEGHTDVRPAGLEFRFPQQITTTGPEEVLRQDHAKDEALSRYERDLELMIGTCLYCRAMGRGFAHSIDSCSKRFEWIRPKEDARRRGAEGRKGWIAPYLVCFRCYQPQDICHVADPDHDETECRFPDMVMPLCYGAYNRPGRDQWFTKHFQQTFKSVSAYMAWLGEKGSLEGNNCIQANCVAAIVLAEFG